MKRLIIKSASYLIVAIAIGIALSNMILKSPIMTEIGIQIALGQMENNSLNAIMMSLYNYVRNLAFAIEYGVILIALIAIGINMYHFIKGDKNEKT